MINYSYTASYRYVAVICCCLPSVSVAVGLINSIFIAVWETCKLAVQRLAESMPDFFTLVEIVHASNALQLDSVLLTPHVAFPCVLIGIPTIDGVGPPSRWTPFSFKRVSSKWKKIKKK